MTTSELLYTFEAPLLYTGEGPSILRMYRIDMFRKGSDDLYVYFASNSFQPMIWNASPERALIDVDRIEMYRARGGRPNDTRCEMINPWPRTGCTVKTYLGKRLRSTHILEPAPAPPPECRGYYYGDGYYSSLKFSSPTFNKVVMLRNE